MEQAIILAKNLFWTRGYDAVSVADITEALGITPPSFYSAFGSKAGLFTQVLDYYGSKEGLPLSDLLRDDKPVSACLIELLEKAAHLYAGYSGVGCLALEGLHSNDPEIRTLAHTKNVFAEQKVHDFIAARYPDKADCITNFVGTILIGLSTKARNGYGLPRLLCAVDVAKVAIEQALEPSNSPSTH